MGGEMDLFPRALSSPKNSSPMRPCLCASISLQDKVRLVLPATCFLCIGSQHAAEYKTKLWKAGVSIALRCIRCWCYFINLMFSNPVKSLKQIGELICTTCTRYIWWKCSWNCSVVLSVCFHRIKYIQSWSAWSSI